MKSLLYWLFRDYLPGAAELFAPIWRVTSRFPGPCRVTPIPISHDCRDGCVHAFWKRPDALLDPQLRATMSVFARLPPSVVHAGLTRLRADLDSGAWQGRKAEVLDCDSLDLGHRLVVWQRERFDDLAER